MARKIRAKLIMELREQGLSRRKIAKTRHMSMSKEPSLSHQCEHYFNCDASLHEFQVNLP